MRLNWNLCYLILLFQRIANESLINGLDMERISRMLINWLTRNPLHVAYSQKKYGISRVHFFN